MIFHRLNSYMGQHIKIFYFIIRENRFFLAWKNIKLKIINLAFVIFILSACVNKFEITKQGSSTSKPMRVIQGLTTEGNIQLKEAESIQYFNWFLTKDKGSCYIYSFPLSSYGTYKQRDLHYIMINYNKSTASNEIAIVGGGLYVEEANTILQISNKNFIFINFKNQAWTVNEGLIFATIKGSPNSDWLVFSNLQAQQTQIIDKYSPLGFIEAFAALNFSCADKPNN
ncbi:hypothetical protein ABSA28_00341 [Candidatus Hepatincolaceae symbiont of Richtersius coronifer]